MLVEAAPRGTTNATYGDQEERDFPPSSDDYSSDEDDEDEKKEESAVEASNSKPSLVDDEAEEGSEESEESDSDDDDESDDGKSVASRVRRAAKPVNKNALKEAQELAAAIEAVEKLKKAEALKNKKAEEKKQVDEKKKSVPSPVKNKAAAVAAPVAAKAPSSPVKAAVAAISSAASSPAKSPTKVRAWVPSINTTAMSSAAGGASTSAKQFTVQILALGDVNFSSTSNGRSLRRSAVVLDLQTKKRMVIIAYGDNECNYMANLTMGSLFVLDLESKLNTPGKVLCLTGETHYYKLTSGTKIRPYTKTDAEDLSRFALQAHKCHRGLISDISAISDAEADSYVSFGGVVMKMSSKELKYGTGVKAVVADQTGYVNVMFFEGKANLVVGASVLVLGAKIWINGQTKAREVSVYNSVTITATNAIGLKKTLLSRAQKQNYADLVNVSAVPSFEVRSMHSLKEEAVVLAKETDTVSGSVMLRLDVNRPSTNGSLTYNGCHICNKKVKVTDDVDDEGHTLYDHEVLQAGIDHRSTNYVTHYLFQGRFKEDNSNAVFTFQVDDRLGERIFNISADDLSALEPIKQTEIMQKATAECSKFNVSIYKTGVLASLHMV